MEIKLGFFGAAQNVTGSQYLLQANGCKVLVDCGLYQEHDLKERNWAPFCVAPSELNAVVLTHAHLDHCGLLPRLVAQGFRGPVYCTKATSDIAQIVMMDSAKLNKEDVDLKKKRHEKEKRKVGHPEVPLYTDADVKRVVPLLKPCDFNQSISLGQGLKAEFVTVGHILGASLVRFTVEQGGEKRTVVFSGDIGRWDMPILKDPEAIGDADYVIMESTYGNRLHEPPQDIPDELAEVINDTVQRGGNLVIPSFAIERTQELLYFLGKLLKADEVPHLRIFVDSPMAVQVTEVFKRHQNLFDSDTAALVKTIRMPGLTMVRKVADSKTINHLKGTAIIIAGAGMCTGGRIKHHLIHNITDPDSTILFVGYQASNTLGRIILDGATNVRILGQQFPVRARIAKLEGFSAHADKHELLRWLDTAARKPRRVFVTHGEPDAAAEFAQFLRDERQLDVTVPSYKDEITLD